MIENEDQYRKRLSETQEYLKTLKPTNLHIRLVFRDILENQENGRKDVEFYTENMEMKDDIRKNMLDKLTKEIDNKYREKVNIHSDYKLDSKINKGQVGILNEEYYPKELKHFISSMKNPASDPKFRTKKESIKENKVPVAFAISFGNVIYAKRVATIKIMSGKKMKYSFVAGTKTHKITTLDEDFLVLTFVEPDMIIYTSDDGTDPTYIYSSNNFNIMCWTSDHMLEAIKKDKKLVENVIDDPDKLFEYLHESWMSVPSAYFMINRQDFKPLKQGYIDNLNSKGIFKEKLRLDKQSKKLETSKLTGREVYNILLERYGAEYTLNGGEKHIIVESYSEVT